MCKNKGLKYLWNDIGFNKVNKKFRLHSTKEHQVNSSITLINVNEKNDLENYFTIKASELKQISSQIRNYLN